MAKVEQLEAKQKNHESEVAVSKTSQKLLHDLLEQDVVELNGDKVIFKKSNLHKLPQE